MAANNQQQQAPNNHDGNGGMRRVDLSLPTSQELQARAQARADNHRALFGEGADFLLGDNNGGAGVGRGGGAPAAGRGGRGGGGVGRGGGLPQN